MLDILATLVIGCPRRGMPRTGMTILKLIKALLRHHLTQNRAEIGMAVCGVVAMLTPLLLWVAWSVEGLKIILMVGFASFLLATWFAQYAAPESVVPEADKLPKPGEFPLQNQPEAKPETWRDVS
jgi:cobalamin biosynthesis protein CobD/CbiB